MDNKKLDLLVIAVHPDDAELGCGGTIAKHVQMEKSVGVVDLTRGELGTRGTAESRDEEAARGSEIVVFSGRENPGFRDGFFGNEKSHNLAVIQPIRKHRPAIIIPNALVDRHPDHGRAGDLVNDSVSLAGLRKIETLTADGTPQPPHRPRLLLQLIQDYYIQPDIAVDVTEDWAEKISASQAYR